VNHEEFGLDHGPVPSSHSFGIRPPNAAYEARDKLPESRMALNDSLPLEEVLLRHKRLRVLPRNMEVYGDEGSDPPPTLVNCKAETVAGPSAQPRRACGFGPSSENESTGAHCNRTGSLRESLQRALFLLARKNVFCRLPIASR